MPSREPPTLATKARSPSKVISIRRAGSCISSLSWTRVGCKFFHRYFSGVEDMKKFRIQNSTALGLILALTAGTAFPANNDGKSTPETGALCSDAWYRSIEKKVPTGDGRGHGPDVGSDEWKSVVEFKLDIRDKPDVPRRDSEAWCRYIDQMVRNSRTSSAGSGNPGWGGQGSSPFVLPVIKSRPIASRR